MSLPIAGARSPSREPTHPALDLERMMRLAADVEDALGELGAESLTPAIVEEIAEELGVRESHVYAAAATMSEIPCAAEAEVQIEVCVGNCQKWGAIELLDRVLDVHGQRRIDGGAAFGVVARQCLDRCAGAAVVVIRTPEGTAGLTAASVASLDEALTELP